MNQPKVSVVIPVYNAEKYIEKCVRSLFEQTLHDLEYIFVIDCSPDKSIQIIKKTLSEYPARRSQVKILNNESNLNVGLTRQKGIDSATGEYIIHCDPDDWVDPYMYDKMYAKAIEFNADLVICDFSHHFSNKVELIEQTPQELTGISVLRSITGVDKHNIHGSLCNKLINRRHVSGINFIEGVNYCEDVAFLFQLIVKNPNLKLAYIPESLYNYRKDNNDSITAKTNKSKILQDLNLINFISKYTECEDLQVVQCAKSLISSLVYKSFNSKLLDNNEFKKLYSNYRDCISYNHQIDSRMYFFMNLAFSSIGYRNSWFLSKVLVSPVKRIFRIVRHLFNNCQNE